MGAVAGGSARLSVLLCAAFLAGASARAQVVPDSTALPAAATPASEAPAPPLPRPAVALPGVEPGRPVTSVPAITSALSAEALLGLVPGVFDERLGAPGRSAGLSVDGLDPARVALLLDGRPLDDLITGAPRFDLLPLAALGPLRVSDGRLGQPASVDAETRLFRLGEPVTELRYLAGQSGVQVVSATHAQTRLPPAFLRGGSRDARLTVSGTVMSRNARGTLAGAVLRHTDVLGRTLLARPGLAIDAGVVYTDRTDGARLGVVPGNAPDLFSLDATVLDANATRRTLRAEAYANARIRLFSPQPLTVTASIVGQRLIYRSDAADTLRVHARRLALRVAQPLGRPLLRLDATLDDDPTGGSDALGDPGARLRLHATLRDSLSLGSALATVEGGAHLDGSRVFPSASGRLERGSSFAALRFGGAPTGRVEEAGLAGFVFAAPDGTAERVLVGEAGTGADRDDLRLGLRAYGSVRWNARLLVARGDAFAFETAPEALSALGLTASVGVRERTACGLYGRLATTLHTPLNAGDSEVARRDVAALPRLRANLRVGTRASGINDVLDLDLAVVGRAWSRFYGTAVEPRTGLLALSDPATSLGAVLPASGTLGIEAVATFADRATVFLQIDHVLGQARGAAVVQGEPLAPRVLRFGVFWALLD